MPSLAKFAASRKGALTTEYHVWIRIGVSNPRMTGLMVYSSISFTIHQESLTVEAVKEGVESENENVHKCLEKNGFYDELNIPADCLNGIEHVSGEEYSMSNCIMVGFGGKASETKDKKIYEGFFSIVRKKVKL